MSISKEEAIEFVRDKLGVEDVVGHDLDLHLLSKIVRGLLSELPFQNIFLYVTPPERLFPTIDEVIRFGMTLHGGVCIHNNWFAALLLRAIGFDLFTIVGMYAATWNTNNNHIMSIVRGLEDPEDPNCKETLFLVDVGNGYPTPGAVPLHRIPVSFPLTAGLELRYDKVGDKYYRMHRYGDPNADPQNTRLNDGWVGKFSFTLQPKEPTSVKDIIVNTFHTDPPSEFMSCMRMFRWPKDQGDRAVGFCGQNLMLFGGNEADGQAKKAQKTTIQIPFDELEENVIKYFPSFDPILLKAAMPSIIRNMKLASEAC